MEKEKKDILRNIIDGMTEYFRKLFRKFYKKMTQEFGRKTTILKDD